jgi:hypothetical protein
MKKYNLTVVILVIAFSVFSQKSETIIAKLTDSVQSWNLLVNGQTIHTIKSGDIFYYYPNIETACSPNGKAGGIPYNKIKIIDSLKYIRFEYSASDLEFEDYDEDLILANRKGINYEELVKKAINKDGQALKEILKIEKYVDGAATEMFAGRFWKIIHFWSDDDLSNLLQNDKSEFRKSFSDFIKNEFYTGFSEKEIEEYLQLFYPKTLKIMKLKLYQN